MRPSLDHFVGRRVENFIQHGKSPEWVIELEGNILIRNKNAQANAPKAADLEGKTLIMVTFSELDTVLKFGTSDATGVHNVTEVTLSPTKYTLGAPFIEKEIYPQMPDDEERIDLPLDPSLERIADGPAKKPAGASEDAVEGTDE